MEYLFSVIIAVVFLLGYNFLIFRGINIVKLFFIINEMILIILSYVSVVHDDLSCLGSLAIFQIALIIFIVTRFRADFVRNEIFEIISKAPFTPLWISGIRNINENEYNTIVKIMRELVAVTSEFEKSTYIIISYSEKQLIFRFVFRSQEDFAAYKEKIILNEINVEIEEVGKGTTMVYKTLIE